MSEGRVTTLPTRSVEREPQAWRLPTWFRRLDARERADRRDRAEDAAQRVGEIKWLWRQACEMSGLARMIFIPSGPTMSIPLIGRVTLGSPTTFTVRLQPGQLLADFEAAGPRIATAMHVAAIRVRPLAADWIVIELQEAPTEPGRAAAPTVVPLQQRGWPHRERGVQAAAA